MAHVYADRAAGRTPLGRRLDRRLLDRATCQAFRDIRGLAEDAVNEAIEAAGERAVVADLAAGPSPYLLHALKRHPGATRDPLRHRRGRAGSRRPRRRASSACSTA